LVACRFNRFNFAYGLEYDFPRGVTDDYFHFVYPYLVDVPGYPNVAMQLATPNGARLPSPVPISKEERQKNFEMLRYIASETGARGLHFQLGIWTHAYQWTDSPDIQLPPCHGSPSQGRASNRARQRGCAGSQGKRARRMAHKLLRAQNDGRPLEASCPAGSRHCLGPTILAVTVVPYKAMQSSPGSCGNAPPAAPASLPIQPQGSC
jgi:hypothetical protein